MPLRTRLALVVALVVAGVLGVRAVLQVQWFELRAGRETRAAVRDSATQLADALEALEWPTSRETLHDMVESIAEQPSLQRVTVLPRPAGDEVSRPAGDELPELTSGARVQPEERALAARTLASASVEQDDTSADRAMAAAPVTRQGQVVAAVVVTASLLETRTLLDVERRLTPWFALAAFLVITAGLTWLARRYIERPIGLVLDTIQRAAGGDLHARVAIRRSDELGRLATGLNEMLDRLHRLDESQRLRIDEATVELRKTNDDLVRSYQKMFALREALARAEQTAAAGQTAANLAHQVGTPLNLVSGYVQMMLEEPGVDGRQAERLRTVQEQIKKVTGHIRATLDHVRLPSPKREPVFPVSMLRRIVDVSRPRLHASGIELTLDVPDELPWLLGDPVRLELALLNLIKNSLDAMPSGGRVVVSARATGEGTVIEVADSGPGIPEGLGERIFEPWVTTKPVGEGTGLGLAFTREVVLAHGGTIDVRTAPGEGATFTIGLPGKSGSPAIFEV